MPELPEVEQVRKTLTPHIKNKTIAQIEIYVERLIKKPTADEFSKTLLGKTIRGLARKGKYLIFDIDGDWDLVVHLRMTGALIHTATDELPKYARIKFLLTDGSVLWYCDTRTLGTLHLLAKGEKCIAGLDNLGVEPIATEFTLEYFSHVLSSKKNKIKGLLLDQSFIAGLGNIYVDEALFLAKILPERTANSLTTDEISALYKTVITVIKQGIINKGTTFRDYRDGDGNKGSNQDNLFVYGRSGKPCLLCSSIIEYKKVAGRGSAFCRNCQK